MLQYLRNIDITFEPALQNLKQFDVNLINSWEYAVRATVSLRDRNKDYRKICTPTIEITTKSQLPDTSLRLLYDFLSLPQKENKKYDNFLLRFGIV